MVRAAVLTGDGEVVVDDVELAPPGPDEAHVVLRAATTCGWDRALLAGRGPVPGPGAPLVLGHEGVGTVAAVGEHVEHVQPDDLVVVTSQRTCGTCATCVRGDPTLCLTSHALTGDDAAHGRWRDAPVRPSLHAGTLAGATVVHGSTLHRLPEGIPDAHALLFACAMPTGIGAVRNVARAWPGERVVVLGAGAVGLAAVQGARLAGAEPVVASDPHASRRALAEQVGAAAAVPPDAAADAVREATDGTGAEHVVVAAPTDQAVLDTALACVRPGGTVVLVGAAGPATAPLGDVVTRGVRVLGTVRGSGRLDDDLPKLLELGMDQRLVLDPLVGPEVDLADVVATLDDPEVLRPLVRP